MAIEKITISKEGSDEYVTYQLLPDENEEHVSLGQIIDYMYLMSTDIDTFRPYMIPYTYITNEDYDPDNFSEELDKSEEDKLIDETFYIISHFGNKCPNEYNSAEWKKNHTKICKYRLDIPQLMLPACENKITGNRNFGGPVNIDTITKWYNDLVICGQGVHSFMLI